MSTKQCIPTMIQIFPYSFFSSFFFFHLDGALGMIVSCPFCSKYVLINAIHLLYSLSDGHFEWWQKKKTRKKKKEMNFARHLTMTQRCYLELNTSANIISINNNMNWGLSIWTHIAIKTVSGREFRCFENLLKYQCLLLTVLYAWCFSTVECWMLNGRKNLENGIMNDILLVRIIIFHNVTRWLHFFNVLFYVVVYAAAATMAVLSLKFQMRLNLTWWLL